MIDEEDFLYLFSSSNKVMHLDGVNSGLKIFNEKDHQTKLHGYSKQSAQYISDLRLMPLQKANIFVYTRP